MANNMSILKPDQRGGKKYRRLEDQDNRAHAVYKTNGVAKGVSMWGDARI